MSELAGTTRALTAQDQFANEGVFMSIGVNGNRGPANGNPPGDVLPFVHTLSGKLTQQEVDRAAAGAHVTEPPPANNTDTDLDPNKTRGHSQIKESVKQMNAPGSNNGCLGGIFSFITSVLLPVLTPIFSFITPLATFVQSTLSPIVTAIDTTKNLFRGGSQQEPSGGAAAAPADPSAANAARTSENLKAFSERNNVRSTDANRKVRELQSLLGAVPQLPASGKADETASPTEPAISSIT
jgi:hypothetical protein